MILYVCVCLCVRLYVYKYTPMCMHMCLEPRRQLPVLGAIPLIPSFPLFSFKTVYLTGPNMPIREGWLAVDLRDLPVPTCSDLGL